MPQITGRFFRDAWELSKPYFTSAERWMALGLLAGIIGINLLQVYINVLLTEWQGLFYDGLQQYDEPLVLHQVFRFCEIVTVWIISQLFLLYFQQYLQIRWRRWMTDRFIGQWLGHDVYYRMQIEGRDTDNPDQRIAEDLSLFPARVLNLGTGLLSSVVTFFSFITLLWVLSGSLTIPLGTLGSVTIPGYAAWGALIYAALGTWWTMKIGRPLIGLTYAQQRFEANFRYSLVRVRENAESIAFYKGEAQEDRILAARFKNIYDNFIALLIRNMKLNVLGGSYNQLAVILPILMAMPKYFAKTMQFGGVMQIRTAFDQVQGSLSFIVNAYSDIAELQAIMFRLAEFRRRSQAIQTDAIPIGREKEAGGGLRVSGLALDLPDGSALKRDINFDVEKGKKLLIMGPTGAGKSTLLRAIAGLWPFGRGTIAWGAEHPLFLPQKPYIPLGTLREAVLYPLAQSDIPDATLAEALKRVGLEKFAGELHQTDSWAQRLSVGEQQRLAFARVLVQQPDMVFLDEATSALSEEGQSELYRLVENLPSKPTIVSVGHRDSLKHLHDAVFALQAEPTAA